MKHVRLYIFLYYSAAMLLEVLYRCFDRLVWHIPPQWGLTFLDEATGFYLAMGLLPWIFFVTRRYPFRLTPSLLAIHAAAVVSFGVVHTSLMWGSRAALSPLVGLGPYDYGSMPMRYFMEFPRQLINYAIWVAAYTIYHNWLRTKDLETQLVSARLSALTHQLQPHFLFNALNAVSAAMYEDLGRADRVLERIADFLRATLRLPDSPLVPLSTELSLARQYLDVMKARLEDRLQFEIHCDAAAESSPVPALLLQPLVENAIEHGQDPVTGLLDVRVDAARHNGFVTISIRDRGRGFSASVNGAGGHGLSNAKNRLRTVYGDRASIEIGGDEASGARVDVRIPVPEAGSNAPEAHSNAPEARSR